MLDSKTILITGGAGSVGERLIPRFLESDLESIRIFENNEPGLASIRRRLDDDRCRYLVGDVRDKNRLERAMQNVDIVVHTAAMKHVDISEYNPFEAVKTNVLGLQNIVDTAIDESVEKLVFTSSDKAVAPSNTMGTTKLLGERLVTAGNKYRGNREITLASVRFGNVVNSSESVVQLFAEQIQNGGPVTLTDERMTRFFLTFEGIGDLVLGALEHMEGGEVFLRKMTAMRIEDLAQAMIDVLAPQYGYDPEQVQVELIGRRIGETIHEHIMTEREAHRAVENGELYAIPPEKTTENGYLTHKGLEGFSAPEVVERSSGEADLLAPAEVRSFVEDEIVSEVKDE
ncbi:SDR family NAD(P)-dependent oxidoreductase [Natronomonas sp. EA1]|uniref:SDR family NAD(P)-dependent oxidoreductase n=1 Tax=Natronomonas sp. EA1 TaxID=3421655 RepID=UPI003EBBD1C6